VPFQLFRLADISFELTTPPSFDTGSDPDFELRVKMRVVNDCNFSKKPRLGIIGL
jgi:hypothetical protein